MTTTQLRQWAFQNSQPDEWWLSVNAVTQQIPVTLSEIEEQLKNGQHTTVQVLHTSQASMEHAPWVDITPQQATSPQVVPPPPIVTIPAAPPVTLPPLAAVASSPSVAFSKIGAENKGHDKDYSESISWFLLSIGIILLIVGLKRDAYIMSGIGIGLSLSSLRTIIKKHKSS